MANSAGSPQRTEIDLTGPAETLGGSRPLRGVLATPSGDGPWPGVVMVHEGFGLDAVNLRHADRLAAMGYLTLAVDLYSAGGHVVRCLVATLRQLTRGRGRAFNDIAVARQWLGERADCTGKIGVIGFCMGGGFALVTANRRQFDAAAVNYGVLPSDLDAAVEGACPILASYGAKDRGLKGAAPKLEAALTEHHVVHDVKLYPDAGHSFLNDAEVGPRPLRPLLRIGGIGPEPGSAVDAWQRIEGFFAAHLG